MKLSGELRYRIGYDVEHDLFHAQNVFNDEYITPTFVEYVQKLEKENKVLAQNLEDTEILNKTYEKRFEDLEKKNAELKTKVTALENANSAMVKELDDTTSGGLNILQNVVKNKEEITKAKEIIKDQKELLDSVLSGAETLSDFAQNTLHKAEQFLNCSEKPNN
jgi:prophage DNA circulation protein